MATLFTLVFLIALICLIIGLIRPKIVIRWGNDNIRTRKKVLMYFGIPLIASFVLVGITAPKPQPKVQQETKQEVKATEMSTTKQTTLGDIKIHYIDVGQGDSELIQIGDKNILIDAGTSDKKALDYLKSLNITKLDYVIATHPHEDHIGSMDDVINNISVGTFYSPKVTTTTKTYENMVNALKNKNLKVTVPKVGDVLNIWDATLTFIAPNSEKYEDLNNYSIVCKLKYGNNSFLFEGDAEDVSENEILAKQLDIQADVLKVGHHGSNSSTTQAYLDKVNPKYAIIEVGKGNDYGHPTEATIQKLNAKGIKTFRTDLNGTIIATSNGTDITFNVNPVDNSVNIAGAIPNKTEAVTETPKTETSKVDTNSSNTTNNSTKNATSSSGTTTNEPAKGDRIVYWTAGGKSYHYDKNCPTLARSKNILQGKASECPKTDPCDKCAK
jgi:beta-lactamase superfamily II metal-dependent hydrolase